MPSEREIAAMELGRPVSAVPDCDGTLFFANLVDALRDPERIEQAVSDLECLVTTEIPGVSEEQHKQLVDLVDASLRYVMFINDELDAGNIGYFELSAV